MEKRMNMSAQEYYKKMFDIDLNDLSWQYQNIVGSFFLEDNYFTKEELEKLIEKSKNKK